MRLVCYQNHPIPNLQEWTGHIHTVCMFAHQRIVSSLRLSACVFIGSALKLRLRNTSVHCRPCGLHRARMSRWATGTEHDATKKCWLQSKHWKLLGRPSWWIQNKISWWWPNNIWTLQTFYWASVASGCDMDMSSLFMWTLLQGQIFETVSSVACTFSASRRLTAKNKFVWLSSRILFGSHPNSRE